jgi:AraC-like DNA-binding protein
MESTFGENEKMNELLRQQNAVMRSTFLMKLMKGRIEDPVRIESSLDSYQLHFASDGFAVILFSIIDLGSIQRREDAASSGDPLDIAQSLVAGIVEEVVRRRSVGCVAEVDRMLGCIVNLASVSREESRRELTMIAREAIDVIHEACGIVVLAGVSDPHESYFGIPVAYQEAMSVMEYQRALEIDDVLSYDQLRTSSGSYNYPIEIEHQLINLIKGGDLEASRAIVDDVFEKNFAHGAVSKDMTRCLVFDLASTMLKTMSEVSTPVDESFLQGLDIAGRLLSCEKIADMKQQMTGILQQICEYIQENRKTRRDTYITSVVRYIDSNYQDANLSVSGIAEQFHLTPTYLIRLFREQTGEGVFHYVTKIRMARAKDLLKDAGHNINDVAARVGYYSNTAFIRAFKKHEGVTPGAYRGTA